MGGRPLQPPRTWKRLLISWEMKKETIWRPLFRTVNLSFIRIRISLVLAWRGDWMEGQKQKEGNQEIFIVSQAKDNGVFK